MVFYFSGTGNSKYAANRISCVLGGSLISMADALKSGSTKYDVAPGESVGFVFPVYCYTIPSVVSEFISKLDLSGAKYVWFVMTCGGSTGGAGKDFIAALKQREIPISAVFGLVMPNNYSPGFKLDPPDRVKRILSEADRELDSITDRILSRRIGDMNDHRGKMPAVFNGIMSGAYDKMRKNAKFKLDTKKCIGCGVCAAVCPTDSVSIKGGRPIWNTKNCSACLSCLHHCKRDAISLGHSEGRGRYLNPNIDI